MITFEEDTMKNVQRARIFRDALAERISGKARRFRQAKLKSRTPHNAVAPFGERAVAA